MAGIPTDGRVALLTGATGGIGRAVALKLAGQGWSLALADRDEEALEILDRELCKAGMQTGVQVSVHVGDVSEERDVAALVRHALDRHGRLDGFVSNAGIPGVVQAVADYPSDVFRRVMEVNVMGTFFCLKHGLPALVAAGGGSFVAMGSTSSIRGRANLAAYVASKHAVLGLVRTTALEQIGTGVRVNAVMPGPIQTPMIDTINAMAAELGPLSRAVQRAVSVASGTPQDVANAVAFLLSPEASHMNGSALTIDGGSTVA